MKKMDREFYIVAGTFFVLLAFACYMRYPLKNGDYAGMGMHYWKHRDGRTYIGIGAPPWSFYESIDQWYPIEKAEKE